MENDATSAKRRKVEQKEEIQGVINNEKEKLKGDVNEEEKESVTNKSDEGKEKEDEEEESDIEEQKEKERGKEIIYIYSQEYSSLCSTMPIHRDRAPAVHSLLSAYGLLDKVKMVPPEPATDEQLTSFHSDEYIEQLKELSKNLPNNLETKEGLEHREGFGLAYDCHPFPKMYDYVAIVAGASLTAAKLLCEKECTIAINTEGGRHHGKKDQASGFCYVNDIVISILALLETFERVLYIDVDIHHGDGVEEAFYLTKKVVTLSFHKQAPGFFPGTGKSSSIGSGRGKNHTINVPLPDDIDDKTYFRIFRELTASLQTRFKPDVIVMQCGSDTIIGDPLGEWHLTPRVVGECAKFVSDFELPTLFLGGGGYKSANVARVWAYILDALTSCKKTNSNSQANTKNDEEEQKEEQKTSKNNSEEKAGNEPIFTLPEDIPEHPFFALYGPDFRLPISSGFREKEWKEEEIEELMVAAKQTISCIPQT